MQYDPHFEKKMYMCTCNIIDKEDADDELEQDKILADDLARK